MNPFKKYLSLFLVLGFYVLDVTGLIKITPMEYILIFFVGVLLTEHLKDIAEINANRVMILTLYDALTKSGIEEDSLLSREDLFYSQNIRFGDTPMDEGNKLKKSLADVNIYIHDYIHDAHTAGIGEEVKKEKVLIFDSFTGLVDRWGKSSWYKINVDE
jgi:hypothetical protein